MPDTDAMRMVASLQCSVDHDQIEKILPCSQSQFAVLKTGKKDTQSIIGQSLFDIPPEVDVERLATAWKEVTRHTPILRSRLLESDDFGFMQVVVKEDPIWTCITPTNMAGSLAEEKQVSAGEGVQSSRFAVLLNPDTRGKTLCWTFSYAMINRTAQRHILREVSETYRKGSLSHVARMGQYRHDVMSSETVSTEAVEAFWLQQLGNFQAPMFPALESPTYLPNPTSETQYYLDHLHGERAGNRLSATAAVRAAWSILIARYTGSTAVIFGSIVDGSNASSDWESDFVGSAAGVVPVYVAFDPLQKVEALTKHIEDQMSAMERYEQTGLDDIRGIGEDGAAACEFQTILHIRDEDETLASFEDILRPLGEFDVLAPHGGYALLLDCRISGKSAFYRARYDCNTIDTRQMNRILVQLAKIVQQLQQGHLDEPVGRFSVITYEDRDEILNWNAEPLKPQDVCIHDMITANANKHPLKASVSAWDGTLTYAEVDDLSSRFARYLQGQGLAVGEKVPLCFERSAWTIVALLGVLKAGGAFALLDVTNPQGRLLNLCRQLSPSVAVTSQKHAKTLEDAVPQCIPIDSAFLTALPPLAGSNLPTVRPNDLAYVLFTSGSTGEPKGSMIEHRGFASCAPHFGQGLGIGEDSRALQFASYSFGVCLIEILATLMLGGCVHVPSEDVRINDITGFIRANRINWAFFTPSFVKVIHPESVPSLQTLALGGEPITAEMRDQWADRVRLVNGYGQSESSTSCSTTVVSRDSDVRNIGRGTGARLWIVEPSDSDRLAAVGCVGELVVESPGIARGYLGVPNSPLSPFIPAPAWARDAERNHSIKFFRTGDLVRYAPNGTIVYLGRGDAQVKIRGQRVELGEVEHHVQQIVSGSTSVVAETVKSTQHGSDPELVVCLSGPPYREELCGSSIAIANNSITQTLMTDLSKSLPRHMLPSRYIIVEKMPTTATGKTDRKMIRKWTQSLLEHDVKTGSPSGAKRRPVSTVERTLQTLWARVLSLDEGHIGLDDNFFQAGGDSIKAIRLVSFAREVNISLTMAQIFEVPTLAGMAATSAQSELGSVEEILPYSLLSPNSSLDNIKTQAAALCGVDREHIEDIYPCTPLQIGLLSETLKHQGEYVACYVLRLRHDIELERFRAAWDSVHSSTAILRTRLVETSDHGVCQVVMKDGIKWRTAARLDTYVEQERSYSPETGSALARYCLIEDSESDGRFFVWTIHHALLDAWSLSLILADVRLHFHHSTCLPRPQFNAFIQYTTQQLPYDWQEFWRSQFQCLDDADGAHFPRQKQSVEGLKLTGRARIHSSLPNDLASGITKASLLRSAWALVATRYAGTASAVFGCTVFGRSAAIEGIERMVGPTIATLPLAVGVANDQSVSAFLHDGQRQMAAMIPYEQTGLQRIAALSPQTQYACAFQTLIVFQYDENVLQRQHAIGTWQQLSGAMDNNTYPLLLECFPDSGGISVSAKFDPRILKEDQCNRLLRSLDLAMTQMSSRPPATPLGEIDILTDSDLSKIWKWNMELPPPVKTCIHEMITALALHQPKAPAICAWDGGLTYHELDTLSTRLAHHLVHLGVRSEMVVPLFFEKSVWTTVAALGVTKAGGASCLLDVTLPEDRLRTIIHQVRPSVVISSSASSALLKSITSQVALVVVDETRLAQLQSTGGREVLPTISPSSTLYVVFTSGSTGTPKGAKISHSNFASAHHHQQDTLRFNRSSRVYDFASYAFDVAMSNMLHTLTAGGCICVPNNDDRYHNAAQCIKDLNVNYIQLTPTAAHILRSPDVAARLKTIRFGGEVLRPSDLLGLGAGPEIIYTYGPAECTVTVIVTPVDRHTKDNPSMGRGSGCVTWIVDPMSPERLAPVGSVGELFLEGPLVGKGYLHDPEKTRATFVRDPPWLLRGDAEVPGRRGQLYRTGDLVRYEEDGSLTFVGRKDAQVKIRGQRLELGEVEYHVRRSMGFAEAVIEDVQLVAEVIRPKGSDRQTLVVFVAPISVAGTAGVASTTTERLNAMVAELTSGIDDRLSKVVPLHMIPNAYIPLPDIPTTATGKTDRRQLRQLGSSLTPEHLIQLSLQTVRQQPRTPAEGQLRHLWASVLKVDEENIGADDSFLQVGGDSILAMQLAAEAREQGLSLSVADIFRRPRLCDQARTMKAVDTAQDGVAIEPFSLLGPDVEPEKIRERVAELCGVGTSSVEDAFPCTALQEGLFAMAARRPGDYIARKALVLQPGVDQDRFKRAWEEVVASTAILRTRIVDLGQRLVQVVLREQVEWIDYNDRDPNEVQRLSIKLGGALHRVGLWTDENNSKTRFIWKIHHALYDGWSLPLILKSVTNAYAQDTNGIQKGQQPTPFQPFIKHVLQHSRGVQAEEFWRAAFRGIEAQIFPSLPNASYRPHADSLLEYKVTGLDQRTTHFSMATIIQAAWATLLARYTTSSEALFGIVSSGRQVDVAGIERIAGPTLAAVPVWVKVDEETSIRQMLQQVRDQSIDTMQYEQTGLQNIRRVSDDAEQACRFQTLVVVQTPRRTEVADQLFEEVQLDDGLTDGEFKAFSTYAMTVVCEPQVEDLLVTISFDSNLVKNWRVERMVQQLEHILRQLCSTGAGGRLVRDVTTTSDWDANDVSRWNADVPETVNACVHDLITEKARQRPSAVAVCSWDGELTYGQLDELSTRLALHLVRLGVGPEVIVPLCFEKSMFTPVAMLGVMKAGGASVLFDVNQPVERLRTIVHQVQPIVIISSAGKAHLPRELDSTAKFVIVDRDHLNDMEVAQPDRLLQTTPGVKPANSLYLIFTSGSTGTPKGVVITHANFSSGLKSQQPALGFSTESRVLDISSYAFDAAWYNALHSFAAGGCLCIPAEDGRGGDLSRYIREHRVNVVGLTPTVAALLNNAALQALTMILLGGEPPSETAVARMREFTSVCFGYGPAECTVIATISDRNSPWYTIGRGVGLRTWIVDPMSSERLAPVGGVGELWLEGPLVGRGYLNEVEKTAAVFVEDPNWLLHQGRRGRLYRTGDLVRYEEDGTLAFVGRKDGQVKIRGQRVELAEVEHHVRKFLGIGNMTSKPQEVQVVAEVVKSAGSDRAMLVVFVALPGIVIGTQVKAAVEEMTRGIHEYMADMVPLYMVPGAYVALTEGLPVTTTGKVDRRQLRDKGSKLTLTELVQRGQEDQERQQPSTAAEKHLQRLWASVLNIEPRTIGVDDTFTRVGGDSIQAIRLVATARSQGLHFSVADVFQQPRLSELAKVMVVSELADDEAIAPFALLRKSLARDEIRKRLAMLCGGVTVSRSSADYVARKAVVLQADVDPSRFKRAWEQVVASMPILRTRIVDLDGQGLVQVIVDEQVKWTIYDHPEDDTDTHQQLSVALGEPLSRVGLREHQGKMHFIWTVHHALFDGWSFPLILECLRKAYEKEEIQPHPPFQRFIKHMLGQSTNTAEKFWQAQFEGSEAQAFPSLPNKSYEPRADSSLEHTIDGFDRSSGAGFTTATMIRAAWATLLARSTSSAEAVLGAVVSGRQANVTSIERIAGPMVATVPVRVKLNAKSRLDELLQQVQTQAAEMTHFEQFGLQQIRRISPELEQATQFQTLLVIQPNEESAAELASNIFEPDQGGAATVDAFSTYALTVVCQVKERKLQLNLRFDSKVICRRLVWRLTRQFEHVLRQFCSSMMEKNAIRLANIAAVSPQDLDHIWTLNAKVPKAVDQCVHELIAEITVEQPSAPAICAWDGKLTYKELDALSDRLAHYLVGRGVGPKVIVPLCFSKSMWTPIAVLGVMKAGGASLILDVTQPVERLNAIIHQVRPKVIVSSPNDYRVARSISPIAPVLLDQKHLLQYRSDETNALPVVKPSDPLYVVFTSGITGTPKGAVVSHGNLASAHFHQQERLRFDKHSRVYDFASYAFDVAWSNLLHTLTAGGCLCIPSDADRLGNTAQSMRDLGANFVHLTPTLAGILQSDAAPGLKTVNFIGEPLRTAHLIGLNREMQILQTYGSAECTVTVTIQEVDHRAGDEPDPDLGSTVGCIAWIVDTMSPEHLAPIGSVGELWLEGPLIGQGYVNNASQTAATFIENPPWLLRGSSGVAGRLGRLYRTGDLVRYSDEDGSLSFVARKDAQVKIRGQQIELGEVEHNVRRLLPQSGPRTANEVTIIAEVVKQKTSDRSVLVVFVALTEAADMTEEQLSASVAELTRGFNDKLANSLPAGMVPSAYVPLRSVPKTAKGKMDRRSLRELGIAKQPDGLMLQNTLVPPSGPIEITLRDIWAAVLNIPNTSISVEMTFVRAGGDSITAMQVVSRCRQKNIHLTVSDVLEFQTIRKLAVRNKQVNPSGQASRQLLDQRETDNKPWILSPVQQRFFDAHPNGLDHVTQSFLLRARKPIPVEKVFAAFRAIVDRHPMLRARFHVNHDGQWEQFVPMDSGRDFLSTEHSINDPNEVRVAAQKRQTTINIRQGPVFAVDLFHLLNGDQALLMTAHHLVIDLVSWRVIWHDLQEYLKGQAIGPQPVSFQAWSRFQHENGRKLIPARVLPFATEVPQFSFWGLTAEQNTVEQSESFTEHIGVEATALLVGKSNDALGTELVDILLTAMIHAFQQIFLERAPPTVFVEGHGRESPLGEDPQIDLSETVGWFTTYCPIRIPGKSTNDTTKMLRAVKDLRRSIPGKGQPYFACRYYSEAGRTAFKADDEVEMLLNYTGMFQQLDNSNSLFTRPGQSDLGDSWLGTASPELRRTSLIAVSATVESGRMTLDFTISKLMKHSERLRQWGKTLVRTLEDICLRLTDMSPAFTLSDFPLLSLSYAGLDSLFGEQLAKMGVQRARVKDVYPCSPLQEGILISQQRGTASYRSHRIWECRNQRHSGYVSAGDLEQAWKAATQRHSAFSTVFAEHPDSSSMIQILLDSPGRRIRRHHSGTSRPSHTLQALPTPDFEPSEPQWEVSICEGADGQVACRLDMSHALCDASSMAILIRDVIAAYSGLGLPASPPFRVVIEQLGKTSRTERLTYWKRYLNGVQPCEVPTKGCTGDADRVGTVMIAQKDASRIYRFCTERGITRQVFLQVAWALTLSYVTGLSEVCFGYLASGRDAGIDGIEEVFGPLINMLVSRVNTENTIEEILEAAHKNSTEHFSHQHASLAEIHHELRLGDRRLFNTAITTRNVLQNGDVSGNLHLTEINGVDPNEYEIVLHIVQHGQETRLGLSHKSSIDHIMAYEIGHILESAILYTLERGSVDGASGWRVDDNASLRRGFFEWHVGSDEDDVSAFWSTQFTSTETVHFPPVFSSIEDHGSYDIVEQTMAEIQWPKDICSETTAIWAAWAILAEAYTNSEAAVFGVELASGSGGDDRETLIDFSSSSASTNKTTIVPVRLSIDTKESVRHLLVRAEEQNLKIARYRNTHLAWIRHVSEDAKRCCEFQTLLSIGSKETGKGCIQDIALETAQSGPAAARRVCAGTQSGAPSVSIECVLEHNSVTVRTSFCRDVISTARAEQMVRQLEHVLRQVCASATGDVAKRVENIETASQQDLRRIWSGNASVPERKDQCVHEMIAETVAQRPEAIAISAWNGELKYSELDALSTRLAHRLVDLGVGPEVIVPLCFDKSVWAPVAMLAVMKAGGASVTLDVTQPLQRLQAIIGSFKAPTVLASTSTRMLAYDLTEPKRVVFADVSLADDRLWIDNALPTEVSPNNTLCIFFTSGSTGTPKGINITHTGFASSIAHQSTAFGMGPQSRVYDFASYSFDIAWFNFVHALASGGCLCVPSEEERRNDITKSIQNFRATCAFLTPSVARMVQANAVPGLEILALGGEPQRISDFSRWPETVRTLSVYGPAECTVVAAVLNGSDLPRDLTVGSGLGSNLWLGSISNANSLAPFGATGEILIEGPLVGQGYLNDTDRTKAAFIEDPLWLLRGAPGISGRHGRLYRTGDLARYEEDGRLAFVGRKDGQVKIRGQRVELGEVEHYVHRLLRRVGERSGHKGLRVVAEVIEPAGTDRPTLVVFISLAGAATMTENQLSTVVAELTDGVYDELTRLVPLYMVPGAYIPLREIPMTVTGKTDRRSLREKGSSLTLKELASLSQRPARERRQPRTTAERQLRSLCASVLQMDERSIGMDDSFMQIGGDSIQAMRLAAAAREKRLSLSVGDIFRRTQLSDLASAIEPETMDGDKAVAPFAMLPTDDPNGFFQQRILPLLLHENDVQDAYPVSYIQKLFLRQSETGAPHRSALFSMNFPSDIDVERLRKSCKALVQHFDMLRTMFVHTAGAFYQVIVKTLDTPIEVEDVTEDMESATDRIWHNITRDEAVGLERLRVRFFILRRRDSGIRLLISINHSQYDGISLAHLVQALGILYSERTPPKAPPFSRYIQLISRNKQEAYDYWRSVLRGASMTAAKFPVELRPKGNTTPRTIFKEKSIDVSQTLGCKSATPATLFTAACALMLAKLTKTEDVTFGRLVSGRHSHPSDCQGLVGPCINYMPVRLRISQDENLTSLVTRAQDQYIDSLPYETIGIDEIVSHCVDWARTTDAFWCVTQYQNIDDHPCANVAGLEIPIKPWHSRQSRDATVPIHPVSVLGTPQGNNLHLCIIASSRHCNEDIIDCMLEELCAAFAGLS
ncbi:acetyl-CoA synthetase-like protein [Polychaeton citri CBS 116435]|uniref:Acetyl-CoA synthetase-like protein n=1 Tax=Polychaeton citri CBS 116435 TaxID=1314669 RepID=A0A9P4ULF4_9PEZI|nr:acetyl-CoA synthetase-like protein [Polychaeton citri CBS 116435]